MKKTTKEFGEISEKYFDKFGESFPTFDFDNDIEKCIKAMQKAIQEKKPYVSTLKGTDYLN